MNKKYQIVIYSVLFISLAFNIVSYHNNSLMKQEIEELKITRQVLIEEKHIMNELIPIMLPTVTKEQLAETIKIKTNEPVDVLSDQIGWRFYHFWFSKDNKITKVTYGS